jgi:hypothetical protein
MQRSGIIAETIDLLKLDVNSEEFFRKNYYIDRDAPDLEIRSKIGQLRNLIRMEKNAKILFSSHRGTGKTTELYNLRNALEGFD